MNQDSASDAAQREPIVRVQDFAAAYGGKTVLRDVTFDVHRGEILVIAGGSGCGKSTLMKHMIGLYHPAGGKILIDGEDIAAVTGQARRALLRQFGVMYQGGALFGSMSVLENVRLPLEEFTHMPRSAMNAVALAKLRLVSLEHAADRLPAELSGGMQKRAAIARAMALDPPIVFLDEPSAGLDPVTSADLDTVILNLARVLQTTFIMVTHELQSILSVADRVIMLDAERKTMIADGPPRALRDHSDDATVHNFFNRKTTLALAAPAEGASDE